MDQKLLFLINREWTGDTLDRLMAAMSSAALWTVPLVVACLALLIRGGVRGRAFVIVTLVAFGLCDGVVGRAVKKSTGRLRPHQAAAGVRVIEFQRPVTTGIFAPLKEKISLGTGRSDPAVEGRSFPSNHASNTFAVACITAAFWNWGWLAFIPALLVAYSRIYTGSHWPSDVAGGIFIGAAVAAFTLVAAELLWRRLGPRISAATAARQPSLLLA